MSLHETSLAGANRRLLEELRDKLAAALDEATEPNDVSRLSARLVEVVDKLGLEPAVQEKRGTPLDELKDRRRSKAGT